MAKKLNIHILGICGAMTTPLAIALKKLGHNITGSDQEKIYPPFSTLLIDSDIPINTTKINNKIDLAIIGTSFKSFQNCAIEYQQLSTLHIPFISSTEFLAQNLIKENSILIAGSHGKTTISAILAWLMPKSNYFFGGMSVENFPSLSFSKSNWSVVEADESINGLDTQAKFLYYPVKYLILTSASWEHKDSYKTAEDNFIAFKKLVQKLPSDGILVYDPNDIENQRLLPFCAAKKVPYAHFSVNTKLIGKHNRENINAVVTLCKELEINTDSVSTFKGIKRRLEIVSNKNNVLIIDDFAQSATRVKSALNAIHYSYPDRPIKIYFEPNASFLLNKESVAEMNIISKDFSVFVLGKIKYSSLVNKSDRVTILNWQDALNNNITYLPNDTDIINYFRDHLVPNDVLVHFSSGGLDGLNNLKKVYNN